SYIAMEWLEGRALDEELRRSGPLSFQRVSEILRQIAAALQEAHSQHIIHRDLKPSNIFLVKRPGGRELVKVLDFGISKSLGDTGGSPVSSVLGTPQYASPEQFRLGENIDSRTDIYSLGVALFQMLTNALPFNDTTITGLIQKRLNESPISLRSLRPDTPPALEDLIDRMLAKQPADRPQNVGDIPELFDRAIAPHRPQDSSEPPTMEAPSGFQHPPTPPSIPAPAQTPEQTLATTPIPPMPSKPPAPVPATAPMPTPERLPTPIPAQPPASRQFQTPIQPPMQYPMRPQMPYPMQPQNHPPAQPLIQNAPPPFPAKRKWRAWTFVIGGAGVFFVILVIGLAIALYMSGSPSAWKEKMETERKAFREGRYLEAVDLAQAELKEAETLGPQDPHLGTSLRNAGELYTRLERYDEAEKYLQRALSIRKNVDAETARTLCVLARLNYGRGNRDKAERLYRQSLAMREKIFGKEHPDVAESLSGLAVVLGLKQIGEAEQMARRSLSIREKALDDKDPAVADSLSALVEVIIDIGKPSEVESYLKRAIDIRERSLGQSHPDLAESLINLGVFLDKRSKCQDAEQPIRRAIAILERTYGTNHPIVARGNLTLANVIAGQGKVSEFEEMSDRAIANLEKSSGPDSRDVARALSVKGTAQMNLGKYKEAEDNLNKSLAIFEKSDSLMGESVAEAYLNLSTLYSKQSAFTKSEEYLKRSISAYENALGKDNPILSALLVIQAINLGRSKRISEAEAKLQEANAGVKKASGSLRATLASLVSYAEALLSLEKGENELAAEKMKDLATTFDESPLVFGNLVHFVYIVSVAEQTKPVIDGMIKVIKERIAGEVTDAQVAQVDSTVQRIEILESTAKRGVTLVEREQCKRNQYLLGEYKTQLAVLYSVKAVYLDSAGRHKDAMAILHDNLPTIQESFTRGGPKSSLYTFFSQYSEMLRQTGRIDDAQEIESFVKEIPTGNVSRN
ncbi:MAG: tetratricopeptide repeat protein, partial [Chloracidobacterium sp.]|nr:tetratricopeptide repeat protein [Chloracidobacterium sp.]